MHFKTVKKTSLRTFVTHSGQLPSVHLVILGLFNSNLTHLPPIESVDSLSSKRFIKYELWNKKIISYIAKMNFILYCKSSK